MFEKEAEEYTCNLLKDVNCNIGNPRARQINSIDVEDGFKAGAEFGYNKANEWHYPSKGEYPKVETWIIGFYYGKDNWHKIFYRTDGKWWGEGQLCQPPFAWKEVTLPKKIKEND